MDDGDYTVAVRVNDGDGSSSIATTDITVNDLGPTAALTGDTTRDQGQNGNYDASGSTSSPDLITSYEWDWDYDGSFDASGDTGAAQSHAWGSVGSHTVAVRVTDEDGSFDIATLGVTVYSSGMLTASLTSGDMSLDEGETGSFDASGSSGPYPITGYEWDWNYDGSFDPSGDTGATQNHSWGDNGLYTAAVRVTDEHNNTDIETLVVTVKNVPPVVNPGAAGPDQTVNEGDTVNFDGSFTDPGNDTHTITWDFGDGSTASGTTTPSHVYADDGIYTVTMTVTDDDGGVGSDSLVVEVKNVPPVVNPGDAGPDQTVKQGDIVNFAGTFTDPGNGDDHTITWNFGDGGSASGSLTPTHVYDNPGIYVVTFTVEDDDGGVGTDTLFITVEGTEPLCGDLDDDGDVDTIDRGIIMSAVNKCQGTTGFIAEADYDGNGCITLNDYRSWYVCYKAYLNR
jgi:hypothetical protein